MKLNYDKLLHETEAAYLIEVDGNKVWVPKSVCFTKIEDIDGGVVEVKKWFILESDLEDYCDDFFLLLEEGD